MEAVPSGWPPSDEGARIEAPLFPLAKVWLFPNMALPLHIFERRYRQMIEDSLDGPGRIVLGTVLQDHEAEMPGSPPVHPIGGLGEIGRHDRLPDGKFNIVLVGLERVRLREIPSDKLYRKVRVEPIDEGDGPEELRAELGEAILARSKEFLNMPEEIPIARMVDFLTLHMPLPPDVMQRLYNETNVAVRAREALEQHAIRPIRREDDGDEPGL